MKRGLSGYVPVKNGIALDYSYEEAIQSLLPICDELIVSDGGSTDGTIQRINDWMLTEPKIRLVHFPWPNVPTYEQIKADAPRPPSQPRMLVSWLNWTRQFCEYDMQITTDADEILDPRGYDAVLEAVAKRECRWFYRHHFWKDHKHVTRDDAVVGSYVARLGPTELEMVSDEPHPEGEPPIKMLAHHDERLRFFHYGFIRRQDAFFAKSKVVQPWIANDYDKRLVKAEQENIPWTDTTDIGPLVPFTGEHPKLMHGWLRAHGFEP